MQNLKISTIFHQRIYKRTPRDKIQIMLDKISLKKEMWNLTPQQIIPYNCDKTVYSASSSQIWL